MSAIPNPDHKKQWQKCRESVSLNWRKTVEKKLQNSILATQCHWHRWTWLRRVMDTADYVCICEYLCEIETIFEMARRKSHLWWPYKLTRALFFLRRSQNFLTDKALLSLYYAIFHSHLLYCPIIVSGTSVKNL